MTHWVVGSRDLSSQYKDHGRGEKIPIRRDRNTIRTAHDLGDGEACDIEARGDMKRESQFFLVERKEFIIERQDGSFGGPYHEWISGVGAVD